VTAAWPFLIGRSKNAGQRLVVAPASREASGDPRQLLLLARGENGPNEAFIADVLLGGEGQQAATAVFRVFRARRSDYLGAGDEPLTDSSGRAIRITEGFIVPLPPGQARALGLTIADLAAAHEQLAPSFREFWKDEDDYVLQYSRPITVGSATGQADQLELRPFGDDSPGAAFTRWPAIAPPVAQPTTQTAPQATAPPTPLRATTRPPDAFPAPRRARRRSRMPLAVLAAIITFGAVVGIYELFASRSAAPESNTGHSLLTTLTAMCGTLDSGKAASAYAFTTSAFRAKTSAAAFSAELTGGTGRTRSCHVSASPGDTRTARMTTTTDAGATRSWKLTLVLSGDTWEISALSAVAK